MNNITDKIAEISQIAKIQEMLEKQKRENGNKLFMLFLGILLGIIFVTGTTILVVKHFNKKKDDDYDLYDDLDRYYDHSDDNQDKSETDKKDEAEASEQEQ